jgi:hypothetical protein
MELIKTLKSLPKASTKRILLVCLAIIPFNLIINVITYFLNLPSLLEALLSTLANLGRLFFLLLLYFLWVRWIANTAEKAGRSRTAFIWVGILFPIIATFVVIVLKPDISKTPSSES